MSCNILLFKGHNWRVVAPNEKAEGGDLLGELVIQMGWKSARMTA